jgi:hypothetical protein
MSAVPLKAEVTTGYRVSHDDNGFPFALPNRNKFLDSVTLPG